MNGRWKRLTLSLIAVFVALMCVGARRHSRLGCGGSLPRHLSVVSAGVETESFIDDDSRTTTVSGGDLLPLTGIDYIQWRGDSSSYVDVYFDAPIFDPTTMPPTLGATYAPFVRYEYVDSRLSDFVQIEFPFETAEDLGLPVPFTRPRAVRVYDRGACSGGASWRKVGEAFAAAFDEARPTILDLVNAAKPDDPDFCDLEPIGNWTVTPQLSEELFGGTLDEFEFAIQYGVQLCAGGNLNPLLLRLRGRFLAQTPALRFRFLGLTARTGNETIALTGAEVRTFIEGAANAALPEAVAQVVTAPGSSTPLVRNCLARPDPLAECEDRFNEILPGFVPGLPPEVFTTANVACVADPRPGVTGTACAFIPNVYRVNHRPEGVEVVVSEGEAGDQFIPYLDDPDVFYPLLELGGACTGEGSSVVGRAPVGGYMGPVFEIPPPGPRPFGDE